MKHRSPPPPRDLEPVWRALASPVRRLMLDLLRDGPRTTGGLAERFPAVSRFAVMQHLGVLVAAGLVMPRRRGRQRFNYLNPVPIQRIYHRWVSRYQEPWVESLVALKHELEGPAVRARATHRTPRSG
ncbi:MAG TPA: metalloregulator ArsR/SmtB family transcription factor [Gemmatimonadales bacterium]